jgi:O-antigen/teichoic acid export membrane protein
LETWSWPDADTFWTDTATAPVADRPPGWWKAGRGEGPGDGQPARSDLSTLAKGGLMSLVGSVASSVLGFLLVVVITRGLHAGRGGVLLEAIALFLILSNSIELGADTAIVRMVSWYRARNRTQDVGKTLQIALWPVIAFGIASAALVYVFAPELARVFIRGRGVDEGARYIRLFAPFVPLAAGTTVALAATRGFGTMTPYVAIQNVGLPLVRPALLLGVLVVGLGTFPIAMAFAAPAAVGFVLSIAWLAYLHRRALENDRYHRGDRRRKTKDLAGEFWRFAAPRGLAGILSIVLIQFNILLVGAFRSSREAGIFAAANRFTGVGTFALQAVGLAIAPQISSLLAQDERMRAETVFQTATWWLMVLSWPIYITMAVFAPFLMKIFGPEFVAGQTALLILSLALLALVGTGNNKVVLLMGGGSAWNLGITVVSLAINLGLSLLLIPKHGMNGSAVAFGSSIVADNVMTTLVVRYRMKLQPFGRGYAVVAAGSLICFGAIGLLVRSLVGMSLASFIVFGVVSSAVYLLFIWRFRKLLQLSVLREVVRSRGGGMRMRGSLRPA